MPTPNSLIISFPFLINNSPFLPVLLLTEPPISVTDNGLIIASTSPISPIAWIPKVIFPPISTYNPPPAWGTINNTKELK